MSEKPTPEDIPEITPAMIEAGEEVLRQIEIWPPDRAHDLAIEVFRAMALHRPKPVRPRLKRRNRATPASRHATI